MRNSLAYIKTFVLFLAFAFAGHVLAAPETWFSGTANGDVLEASAADWYTNDVGEVSVAESVLSIDLPTNKVVKLTPSSCEGKSEKKTYVVVDGAVFTPTAYVDIDSTVVEGAQTALTVAYDDTPRTNYWAYISGTWTELEGVAPVEDPVNVTIELDYSNSDVTNASFKVGETTLHQVGHSETTSFQISGSQRALDRVELAGYGKIHSITTSVEAAVANLTITPGDVTYGADFTNVTIVATIEGEGAASATYKLNWKTESYDMTVVSISGNSYTLRASIPFPANGRESVNYTISAEINDTPAGTSDATATVVADNRPWVTEDVDNQHTTGSWSAGNVEYENSAATVSDNIYTASNCSTGDLVTITFENLVYTEFSDLSVETPLGTQGAFALAEDNGSTNFYILAWESDYTWKAATCTGVEANTNIAYTVVMTFDYVANKYSVAVSDGTTTNNLTVSEQTQFNLCTAGTSVSALEFKGSGKMTGIKGVESIGYMATDGLGHWLAKIEDVLLNSSGNGPFIILRDTGVEAPNGWQFVTEGGVRKLVKKVAKGLFFMAF